MIQYRSRRLDSGWVANQQLLTAAYLQFFVPGGGFNPPAPNGNVIGFVIDDDDPPRRRKRPPPWEFDILAIQALLFPATTIVPEVEGLDISVATTILQNATLIGASTSAPEDLSILYNQVFSQDIPAGTLVGQGSVVNLVVQSLTIVPFLIGLQQALAVANLNAAHLASSEIGLVSSAPPGQVLAQSIDPGRGVSANTVVVLTVAISGDGFRVMAATAGTYKDTYYNPGDVFDLVHSSDYSDSTLNYENTGGEWSPGWMTRVAQGTPLTLSDGTASFPAVDPNRRFVE